jgi:hypothetical protein
MTAALNTVGSCRASVTAAAPPAQTIKRSIIPRPRRLNLRRRNNQPLQIHRPPPAKNTINQTPSTAARLHRRAGTQPPLPS